jgi:hypothetical protein
MHESLKKYQKWDTSGALSDFDKMMIKYYVVSNKFYKISIGIIRARKSDRRAYK